MTYASTERSCFIERRRFPLPFESVNFSVFGDVFSRVHAERREGVHRDQDGRDDQDEDAALEGGLVTLLHGNPVSWGG